MKYSEITAKTEDELKGILLDMKKQLFRLRFQKSSGELQNSSQFGKTKKTIARVLTRINEVKNS